MAYKDPEKQRAAARRHYDLNKDKIKARAKLHSQNNKARVRQYIQALKDSTPCVDCHIQWPHYVSQFDHIGTDKRFNVADFCQLGLSLSSVQAEIAKCELVCANCHAIRTYQRRTARLPGFEPGITESESAALPDLATGE